MAETSVPWGELNQNTEQKYPDAKKTISMPEYREQEDKRLCERNFGRYHYGVGTVLVENQDAIRRHFKALAEEVCMLCPEGRERSLALTKLEEGLFWAREALGRR